MWPRHKAGEWTKTAPNAYVQTGQEEVQVFTGRATLQTDGIVPNRDEPRISDAPTSSGSTAGSRPESSGAPFALVSAHRLRGHAQQTCGCRAIPGTAPQRLLDLPLDAGLIGGRISGGGSGGTVVVVLEQRALDTLRTLALPEGHGLII